MAEVSQAKSGSAKRPASRQHTAADDGRRIVSVIKRYKITSAAPSKLDDDVGPDIDNLLAGPKSAQPSSAEFRKLMAQRQEAYLDMRYKALAAAYKGTVNVRHTKVYGSKGRPASRGAHAPKRPPTADAAQQLAARRRNLLEEFAKFAQDKHSKMELYEEAIRVVTSEVKDTSVYAAELQASGNELRYVAASNASGMRGRVLHRGEGISFSCVDDGETIVVENVGQAQDHVKLFFSAGSDGCFGPLVLTPLRAESQLVGILAADKIINPTSPRAVVTASNFSKAHPPPSRSRARGPNGRPTRPMMSRSPPRRSRSKSPAAGKAAGRGKGASAPAGPSAADGFIDADVEFLRELGTILGSALDSRMKDDAMEKIRAACSGGASSEAAIYRCGLNAIRNSLLYAAGQAICRVRFVGDLPEAEAEAMGGDGSTVDNEGTVDAADGTEERKEDAAEGAARPKGKPAPLSGPKRDVMRATLMPVLATGKSGEASPRGSGGLSPRPAGGWQFEFDESGHAHMTRGPNGPMTGAGATTETATGHGTGPDTSANQSTRGKSKQPGTSSNSMLSTRIETPSTTTAAARTPATPFSPTSSALTRKRPVMPALKLPTTPAGGASGKKGLSSTGDLPMGVHGLPNAFQSPRSHVSAVQAAAQLVANSTHLEPQLLTDASNGHATLVVPLLDSAGVVRGAFDEMDAKSNSNAVRPSEVDVLTVALQPESEGHATLGRLAGDTRFCKEVAMHLASAVHALRAKRQRALDLIEGLRRIMEALKGLPEAVQAESAEPKPAVSDSNKETAANVDHGTADEGSGLETAGSAKGGLYDELAASKAFGCAMQSIKQVLNVLFGNYHDHGFGLSVGILRPGESAAAATFPLQFEPLVEPSNLASVTATSTVHRTAAVGDSTKAEAKAFAAELWRCLRLQRPVSFASYMETEGSSEYNQIGEFIFDPAAELTNISVTSLAARAPFQLIPATEAADLFPTAASSSQQPAAADTPSQASVAGLDSHAVTWPSSVPLQDRFSAWLPLVHAGYPMGVLAVESAAVTDAIAERDSLFARWDSQDVGTEAKDKPSYHPATVLAMLEAEDLNFLMFLSVRLAKVFFDCRVAVARKTFHTLSCHSLRNPRGITQESAIEFLRAAEQPLRELFPLASPADGLLCFDGTAKLDRASIMDHCTLVFPSFGGDVHPALQGIAAQLLNQCAETTGLATPSPVASPTALGMQATAQSGSKAATMDWLVADCRTSTVTLPSHSVNLGSIGDSAANTPRGTAPDMTEIVGLAARSLLAPPAEGSAESSAEAAKLEKQLAALLQHNPAIGLVLLLHLPTLARQIAARAEAKDAIAANGALLQSYATLGKNIIGQLSRAQHVLLQGLCRAQLLRDSVARLPELLEDPVVPAGADSGTDLLEEEDGDGNAGSEVHRASPYDVANTTMTLGELTNQLQASERGIEIWCGFLGDRAAQILQTGVHSAHGSDWRQLLGQAPPADKTAVGGKGGSPVATDAPPIMRHTQTTAVTEHDGPDDTEIIFRAMDECRVFVRYNDRGSQEGGEGRPEPWRDAGLVQDQAAVRQAIADAMMDRRSVDLLIPVHYGKGERSMGLFIVHQDLPAYQSAECGLLSPDEVAYMVDVGLALGTAALKLRVADTLQQLHELADTQFASQEDFTDVLPRCIRRVLPYSQAESVLLLPPAGHEPMTVLSEQPETTATAPAPAPTAAPSPAGSEPQATASVSAGAGAGSVQVSPSYILSRRSDVVKKLLHATDAAQSTRHSRRTSGGAGIYEIAVGHNSFAPVTAVAADDQATAKHPALLSATIKLPPSSTAHPDLPDVKVRFQPNRLVIGASLATPTPERTAGGPIAPGPQEDQFLRSLASVTGGALITWRRKQQRDQDRLFCQKAIVDACNAYNVPLDKALDSRGNLDTQGVFSDLLEQVMQLLQVVFDPNAFDAYVGMLLPRGDTIDFVAATPCSIMKGQKIKRRDAKGVVFRATDMCTSIRLTIEPHAGEAPDVRTQVRGGMGMNRGDSRSMRSMQVIQQRQPKLFITATPDTDEVVAGDFLSVPLHNEGCIVGAMCVDSVRSRPQSITPQPLNELDVNMLKEIGTALGEAIDKLRKRLSLELLRDMMAHEALRKTEVVKQALQCISNTVLNCHAECVTRYIIDPAVIAAANAPAVSDATDTATGPGDGEGTSRPGAAGGQKPFLTGKDKGVCEGRAQGLGYSRLLENDGITLIGVRRVYAIEQINDQLQHLNAAADARVSKASPMSYRSVTEDEPTEDETASHVPPTIIRGSEGYYLLSAASFMAAGYEPQRAQVHEPTAVLCSVALCEGAIGSRTALNDPAAYPDWVLAQAAFVTEVSRLMERGLLVIRAREQREADIKLVLQRLTDYEATMLKTLPGRAAQYDHPAAIEAAMFPLCSAVSRELSLVFPPDLYDSYLGLLQPGGQGLKYIHASARSKMQGRVLARPTGYSVPSFDAVDHQRTQTINLDGSTLEPVLISKAQDVQTMTPTDVEAMTRKLKGDLPVAGEGGGDDAAAGADNHQLNSFAVSADELNHEVVLSSPAHQNLRIFPMSRLPPSLVKPKQSASSKMAQSVVPSSTLTAIKREVAPFEAHGGFVVAPVHHSGSPVGVFGIDCANYVDPTKQTQRTNAPIGLAAMSQSQADEPAKLRSQRRLPFLNRNAWPLSSSEVELVTAAAGVLGSVLDTLRKQAVLATFEKQAALWFAGPMPSQAMVQAKVDTFSLYAANMLLSAVPAHASASVLVAPGPTAAPGLSGSGSGSGKPSGGARPGRTHTPSTESASTGGGAGGEEGAVVPIPPPHAARVQARVLTILYEWPQLLVTAEELTKALAPIPVNRRAEQIPPDPEQDVSTLPVCVELALTNTAPLCTFKSGSRSGTEATKPSKDFTVTKYSLSPVDRRPFLLYLRGHEHRAVSAGDEAFIREFSRCLSGLGNSRAGAVVRNVCFEAARYVQKRMGMRAAGFAQVKRSKTDGKMQLAFGSSAVPPTDYKGSGTTDRSDTDAGASDGKTGSGPASGDGDDSAGLTTVDVEMDDVLFDFLSGQGDPSTVITSDDMRRVVDSITGAAGIPKKPRSTGPAASPQGSPSGAEAGGGHVMLGRVTDDAGDVIGLVLVSNAGQDKQFTTHNRHTMDQAVKLAQKAVNRGFQQPNLAATGRSVFYEEAVNDLRHRLSAIEKTALSEIKSYTNPPELVAVVMRATFQLLQYRDEEVSSWSLQKVVFVRDNVWKKMVAFDPFSEGLKSRGLLPRVQGTLSAYHVDDVMQKASVPVAGVFEWDSLMVQIAEDNQAAATQ